MAITCNCPMSQPGPTLAATCGGGAFMLFMGLLEVFLRSQCDLEDPCGRTQYRRHMDSVYDFIVIGGGSAGSVVASRLSEVPEWRVLLLEAGFDEPTGAQVPSMFLNFIGSSIDWGYHTEPEPAACLSEKDRKCYWPRGKVLGGTSVMNGMMYIRGSRKDYDDWAAAGNEGWSYEEVLPYFMKSEDNKQIEEMDKGYHATGGPLTVSQFPYHPPLSYSIIKAGEELGYQVRDLNGEAHTGFSIAQTTNRNGSRISVARAFLRPAKNRPNLHVMLNATVTKVLINQTTRQAYAVEVRNSFGGTEVIFANNEIILSGGAVASPQILQLSGIGDPEVLSRAGVRLVHKLPAVGRNLHNHVAHFLNFHVNDNNTTPLNWATAMEYLLFRDGLMSGTGISEVTALINTKYANPEEDNPDVQLFFGGFLADCAKTGMVGEKLGDGSRSVQMFPAVLHPKSRGRLEIASSDPFAYPKIYANYLTHPDDVKTLIEGIKFAIKLSETKTLKKYGMKLDKTPVKGCEKFKFGCDAYWECAVRMQTAPENHQAGSCKMGPRGDPTAVVDNLLQVQGIDRLRVADASVMPAVTSGNTNAPTVMIGERAADFIKKRWLGGTTVPYPLNNEGGVSNVLSVSESRYPGWQRWA
ncbi:glucose dehydrogenase [FAD, quinone] [Vanessa tameamea]|uniref:Glucose dehydrogenase [FAD, quinone] n=1 Tax=Vanessa tameamea TaxID=334116 RepID=A0A8B8HVT8_VANTA|nr:glucose dehydrogenase [FAD, quinone] [Vanessa tameamea]XP_026488979.1 glucose dehydrogenase [FAD, quinone] [Vanessa tameamea]